MLAVAHDAMLVRLLDQSDAGFSLLLDLADDAITALRRGFAVMVVRASSLHRCRVSVISLGRNPIGAALLPERLNRIHQKAIAHQIGQPLPIEWRSRVRHQITIAISPVLWELQAADRVKGK